MVSLANNHLMDYGRAGPARHADDARRRRASPTSARAAPWPRRAGPRSSRWRGVRFALLGYFFLGERNIEPAEVYRHRDDAGRGRPLLGHRTRWSACCARTSRRRARRRTWCCPSSTGAARAPTCPRPYQAAPQGPPRESGAGRGARPLPQEQGRRRTANYLRRSRARRRLSDAFLTLARLDSFFLLRFPFGQASSVLRTRGRLKAAAALLSRPRPGSPRIS